MVLSGTSAGLLSTETTATAWGTSLKPMNRSDWALPVNETQILIYAMTVFTIALVGLPGNAVVLWVLGFRLRRTAFSVYILNLAAADCFLLCSQISYSLEEFIRYFCSSTFFIPHFFSTVLSFTYVAGLSFLGAISTERCLSVLWPIWYRCHRPPHTSAVTCALLWALSGLLSILLGTHCGLLSEDFHPLECTVFNFTTVAWLVLLFVLLSGSSLALMTRLLCGPQRAQPTRLYVTILLSVLVFILCGLPFGIHWFLLIWLQQTGIVSFHLYLLAVLLSGVNSCANPIIYFFVGSFRQRWWKRRQTLKQVLQRALQDTPEVDGCGDSLPQGTLEVSGSSLVF